MYFSVVSERIIMPEVLNIQTAAQFHESVAHFEIHGHNPAHLLLSTTDLAVSTTFSIKV